MKKTLTILAILVVVAGVIGAIIWAGREPETNKTTQDNTSDQGQETTIITYKSSGFSPAETTVAAGGSVTFVNESDAEIEPASDPHPTHTNNPELNAGDIEPGQSKTVTVSTTGTWGFHNHYKTEHKGTITVE